MAEYPTGTSRSYTAERPINTGEIKVFRLDEPLNPTDLASIGDLAANLLHRFADIGGLQGFVLMRPNGFTVTVYEASAWETVEPKLAIAYSECIGAEVEVVAKD